MLTRIDPTDVCDEDILWLLKATEGHYGGYSPEHIVKAALDGRATLWRVGPLFSGIVVTTVVCHPGGKELMVWWMAGRGILARLGELFGELEVQARLLGCIWVSGVTKREGLVRECGKNLPLEFQDRLFIVEVENGRTKTA